jgi:hypothetical protein
MAIAAEIVPAKPSHVPGRVWYFIAALIFLAGLAAMLTLMVEQLSGIGSRMIQVIVPGQSELTLDKAGTYTIFHEYRSTVGTRVFAVETVSGLSVTVRSKATGEDILLQTTTGASYTVEGRSGRSILNFKITEPGTYLLIAGYSDGRREPQTVITVDRGFVGSNLAYGRGRVCPSVRRPCGCRRPSDFRSDQAAQSKASGHTAVTRRG